MNDNEVSIAVFTEDYDDIGEYTLTFDLSVGVGEATLSHTVTIFINEPPNFNAPGFLSDLVNVDMVEGDVIQVELPEFQDS